MKKILFLCTGNTCRSPMAELILKDKLKRAGVKNVRVSSAGLHAEVGSTMSANSRLALAELGIKSAKFRARQADEKMILSSNLVLVMTHSHKAALAGMKNVFTLAEFTGCGEVSDPYGGSLEEYMYTRRQLEAACDVILKTIL